MQLGSLWFPERSQAHTQNLNGPRPPRRGAVQVTERNAAESTSPRSLDELKTAFVLR